MQPGVHHAVAHLERPAGCAEHDGEAVADRLAYALGAFGTLMLFCHALSLGRPMPIYEYRCADCGKRPSIFFKSLTAVEESPACPLCGGRHLTRLISRTAQVQIGRASCRERGEIPGVGGTLKKNR